MAALIASTALKPIALRKAKIVYNFGLFECNRVKWVYNFGLSECNRVKWICYLDTYQLS